MLNRLASERLVVAEGKRGFEVAPISIDNLKELADLRLLLECHAIEQSFARADVEVGRPRRLGPSQARARPKS